MIRGIIYMYTGPNGKSYIGQTINEDLRRKLWNSVRYHYAGDKIDRARKKYGKNSFTYEILFEKNFNSKYIASIWLNVAEQYYIQLYNTVDTGYNCEYGGGGNANHTGATNHHHGGYKLSEEARKHIGQGSKEWQNSLEGKAKMSRVRKGITKKKGYRIEAKYKPVVQLSMKGEFVQEFASIRDAAESISIDINSHTLRVNIGNTCKGRRDSAGGYRWLYKDDYLIYFLNPKRQDIPDRVLRQLNGVCLRKDKNIIRPAFCKKIAQFDLLGNKVAEYNSVKEAANSLGKRHTAISQCLRGNSKTSYGYVWRYV